MTGRRRAARHQQGPAFRTGAVRHRARWLTVIGMAVVVAAIAVVVATHVPGGSDGAPRHARRPENNAALPVRPGSYLGVYADQVPASYAGLTSFTRATGVRPNLVLYYSGWLEPFKARFASVATRHGAVPLVQIDPTGVSVAAIASGQYDTYLISYAKAVRSFHRPVILSFGHEMNGHWYSWGNRHTPPSVFVAAWRHIVDVFRTTRAGNVTWLWTVNVITRASPHHWKTPDPAAWWPGASYVTWVGIDGYYHKPAARFSQLFGPTIVAVREFAKAPILIAETGAAPAVGQSAKIADLFAGIRSYGLLGFVWFDSVAFRDYRIEGHASIAALRHGAQSYGRHVQ